MSKEVKHPVGVTENTYSSVNFLNKNWGQKERGTGYSPEPRTTKF